MPKPGFWGYHWKTLIGRPAGAQTFIQAPSTVRTPEWFMSDLGEAVGEVRKHFSGLIDTAVDLQCIPIR